MFSGMFDGLDTVFYWLLGLSALGIILGIWKAVEIVIWIINHVKVV